MIPLCPFVSDLGFTLAYAKAYLLLRRIGVSLIKEAMLFDQALVRFDQEMHKLEVRLDLLRHRPYSFSWTTGMDDKVVVHSGTPVQVLTEVNTPCSRYVKHHGVWKEIGELMNRARYAQYSTTMDEAHYFSYRVKEPGRYGVDSYNSYWSRRVPKGPRRDA